MKMRHRRAKLFTTSAFAVTCAMVLLLPVNSAQAKSAVPVSFASSDGLEKMLPENQCASPKAYSSSHNLVNTRYARQTLRLTLRHTATACLGGQVKPNLVAFDVAVSSSTGLNPTIELSAVVSNKESSLVLCPATIDRKPGSQCLLLVASGTYSVKAGVPTPWGPVGVGGSTATWKTEWYLPQSGSRPRLNVTQEPLGA